mmetsp:Transcript_3217/g.19962  ORF Transcript_3217/g.19962 Transcript_3217/m.19962 type:complete len:278 (+) Transcript_3217:5502-6335(+)
MLPSALPFLRCPATSRADERPRGSIAAGRASLPLRRREWRRQRTRPCPTLRPASGAPRTSHFAWAIAKMHRETHAWLFRRTRPRIRPRGTRHPIPAPKQCAAACRRFLDLARDPKPECVSFGWFPIDRASARPLPPSPRRLPSSPSRPCGPWQPPTRAPRDWRGHAHVQRFLRSRSPSKTRCVWIQGSHVRRWRCPSAPNDTRILPLARFPPTPSHPVLRDGCVELAASPRGGRTRCLRSSGGPRGAEVAVEAIPRAHVQTHESWAWCLLVTTTSAW